MFTRGLIPSEFHPGRISFFRANPQYGMRKGKDQKNADTFGEEVTLPGCLTDMITSKVLPNCRTESYGKEFKDEILPQGDVQVRP